jgi:ABC-2 type transport system ATP-binding protein
MTAPAQIATIGLTKSFGSVVAVTDLSFTAEPGMVTGFLGPNGAGKSTTLRMLLGLVQPDCGAATIGGQRYRALARPGRSVGAVLDADGFHPSRTGLNHLLVYCSACGYPPGRAVEMLELTGLAGAARRKVGGYSLGMRQRLALATALLGDPSVLVLDEPANGLDPEGIAWLRALLRTRAREGSTVLFSSHTLAEVEQIADQVVIIGEGRLVAEGTLAALTRDASVVNVRASDSPRLANALGASGATTQPAGRDGLRVAGLGAADISRIARAEHIDLHELTNASSLEDAFLRLTSRAGLEPSPQSGASHTEAEQS